MVPAGRRAPRHDRVQCLRGHVLFPRRAPREPCDRRARHLVPALCLLVLRRLAGGRRRARGDRVLVLALRRRGVDRRLHRGLPGGPMTPPPAAEPQTIEMPAPTAWPLALALGITLTVAGLVTNVIVSAVGVTLTLAAALGWWRQVLPEAKYEQMAMRSVAEQARPIVPSEAAV